MLAQLRRGARSSARVCARTTFAQQVFTAVLRVAEKYFLAGAAIMDNVVQLQRKEEKGGRTGKPRAGKVDRWGGQEEEELEARGVMGYAVH